MEHDGTRPGYGSVVPTDHELLTQVLEWLAPAGPQAMHLFYGRLFEAAPELRDLFPERIEMQEERLLSAIVHLFTLFDAGDDAMEQLNNELARFGRSHTRFDPPATLKEYAAVKTVLFGVLTEMLGDKLTPQHSAALVRCYEYAAGRMLAAQATVKLTDRDRRRRTV